MSSYPCKLRHNPIPYTILSTNIIFHIKHTRYFAHTLDGYTCLTQAM